MIYSELERDSTLTKEDNQKNLVIDNYFATINREDFEQTAAFFAEDGKLLAPFEEPILGRDAIALYLQKEAKGMKLLPQKKMCELTADNVDKIKVTGKVKTSLFSVNVAWFFNFNSEQQITEAKIKLLASPQELLGLRN
ncbi:MAG: ketosteroid isomerase family protein [Waterburya sp.]